MGYGIRRVFPRHDTPVGARLRGFSLAELLIVLAIIGILALIVVVTLSGLAGSGRTESMAITARHIRELICYKAAAKSVPLSAGGFPLEVDPAWFSREKLPYHTWTNQPMVVETVTAGADDDFPAIKTFDLDDNGSATAWYNATNGAFCVRIPPQSSDDETLETFNTINACTVTAMGQTTE
ncbi:MAG: prepilin-type N-terminal cleavage/methylation domain-containing protein [Phycisphaerales bacterium]|nr:MAG: prepilin-type N-terminal cleavage/methylation domain-containing protein [Phycisphaerales bacterium]